MQILWFSLVIDELKLLWTNDGNEMKSQSPILATPGIRSSRHPFFFFFFFHPFCNCQTMCVSLFVTYYFLRCLKKKFSMICCLSSLLCHFCDQVQVWKADWWLKTVFLKFLCAMNHLGILLKGSS